MDRDKERARWRERERYRTRCLPEIFYSLQWIQNREPAGTNTARTPTCTHTHNCLILFRCLEAHYIARYVFVSPALLWGKVAWWAKVSCANPMFKHSQNRKKNIIRFEIMFWALLRMHLCVWCLQFPFKASPWKYCTARNLVSWVCRTVAEKECEVLRGTHECFGVRMGANEYCVLLRNLKSLIAG